MSPTPDEPWVIVLARRPANRQLLAEVIESTGCGAHSVGSLEEVDDALDKETYALGLVDLDGYTPQVWAMLRRLADRGVPSVVMTRSRTEEIQEETLKIGVRSVLEKPVGKANLKALVRSLVKASGPSSPDT